MRLTVMPGTSSASCATTASARMRSRFDSANHGTWKPGAVIFGSLQRRLFSSMYATTPSTLRNSRNSVPNSTALSRKYGNVKPAYTMDNGSCAAVVEPFVAGGCDCGGDGGGGDVGGGTVLTGTVVGRGRVWRLDWLLPDGAAGAEGKSTVPLKRDAIGTTQMSMSVCWCSRHDTKLCCITRKTPTTVPT